ncbi:MAG: helix-turn-helix domain-containing protein [Spirochaetes bacterium]|nr:helix-turn-helix domain-containing protein [Spirochaetota bacterium]
MKEKLYSVEEAAQILDLHPKTVQRFIREGGIKGNKIGREWRIPQASLKEFTHAELAENPVTNNSETELKKRIHVSAVIEIDETNSEEASRISNSIIAVLNSKDPDWGKTRYDLIYHPETQKARFILYGTPAFLSQILKMIDTLTQQEENL